jgi:hypothetical protein
MSEETVFRDGFPVPKLKIAIPDTINLDPETKRKVTICNLFINHELPVRDIVRVLDEDYRQKESTADQETNPPGCAWLCPSHPFHSFQLP